MFFKLLQKISRPGRLTGLSQSRSAFVIARSRSRERSVAGGDEAIPRAVRRLLPLRCAQGYGSLARNDDPADFGNVLGRLMLGLLLLTLLAGEIGCGGPAPTPTIPKPTVRLRPTEPPTLTKVKPTPTSYPTPNPALIDSDGDLYPDEVEAGMGSDPFVHDCLRKAGCEGPSVTTPGGIMNVLLVLDASAGMDGEVEGQTKMELAKAALTQYAHDLPPGVNAGLMVYGHRGSTGEGERAILCQR